jgi:hypothetical protein
MKAKYIKPESEEVVVKLYNSVLDSIGLGGQTVEASDVAAKGNKFFDDEEEGEASQSTNIWDK